MFEDKRDKDESYIYWKELKMQGYDIPNKVNINQE